MQAFRERQKASGHYRATITLSREEYERMAASAQAHGEKITTHLKTQALAHLDNRYLVPPDMLERTDALLSILRGIGNNLNQLARYSNEMQYFLDTQEVRLQLRRLTEAIEVFIQEPPPASVPDK